MPVTIPGFRYERVAVADGVRLNTAIGGAGRPLVLLHGFPQTHLCGGMSPPPCPPNTP